jgi:hypothetical protein
MAFREEKMLTAADLYSLEHYARIRPDFRARVIAHKKQRRLPLGEHAALYFESALTMHYQVQEMLRIERIFEPAGIAAELAVYNPLVPDGSNWKATFMLEYADENERRQALARLIGIENRVWLQVAGCPPLRPFANEDLPRDTADKTAAVHFLRFELTPPMVAAVKAGAAISGGIDHPAYIASGQATPEVRAALAADLV